MHILLFYILSCEGPLKAHVWGQRVSAEESPDTKPTEFHEWDAHDCLYTSLCNWVLPARPYDGQSHLSQVDEINILLEAHACPLEASEGGRPSPSSYSCNM